MQATYSVTYGSKWQKIFTTDNSADTAFTTYTPLVEAGLSASTDGVISPVINNEKRANLVHAVFMALDTVSAANDDFNVRITGWNLYEGLWIPHQITVLVATIGTTTGVDGSDLEDEYLFVDGISQTSGDSDVKIISPEDNSIASVMFDPTGSELVQFEFDMGTGSPTLCNGLWRLVS